MVHDFGILPVRLRIENVGVVHVVLKHRQPSKMFDNLDEATIVSTQEGF
jgi:hypothetical protein